MPNATASTVRELCSTFSKNQRTLPALFPIERVSAGKNRPACAGCIGRSEWLQFSASAAAI